MTAKTTNAANASVRRPLMAATSGASDMTSTTRTAVTAVDAEEQPTSAGKRPRGEEERLFYSEAETATIIGIHRTTLRMLALAGKAPVEAIHVTEHRRVYRKRDVHRLAGLET